MSTRHVDPGFDLESRLRRDACDARATAPALGRRTADAIASCSPLGSPRGPGFAIASRTLPARGWAFAAMAACAVLAVWSLPRATTSGMQATALRGPAIVIEVDTARLEAAFGDGGDGAPLDGTLLDQMRLAVGDARRVTDLFLARVPLQPLRVATKNEGS